MGSRGLLLLKGDHGLISHYNRSSTSYCFNFSKVLKTQYKKVRSFSSTTTKFSLQPPDVPRLAEKARIALTPNEIEEFEPKIRQVIDWFGQLQAVDLHTVEPSIRAGTENNLRDDAPEPFEHRDAMIAAVPGYEEPYIKVPRVLNKE
ncbi:Glutamyl-tRNA(Gln) amidotransferase subunit C, chloroplastic/mitochondrial [Quillaja saponaria]|uniref:Glutamyl-tRNA(Gln) amidotransferase subunit C, chloroplastic/mitochondrial n=1 Tax=Quillaja saponaria TaxID=32244 RepID=A0AAD7PSK6_QUISA|nr:Glutamyl-tRNA(Gln) amidotransferase subunit C, chloroplastic/mitochondrial [Quillaja saponaria]